MINKFSLLILLNSLFFVAVAQRSHIILEKGWKFTRQDDSTFSQSSMNDKNWQGVTVPHDWAIYGPFNEYNDLQVMAIKQDGQKEAKSHAGRTGGLPFVGVGWYRNKFNLPDTIAQKSVSILFDGAMSNANVFINGIQVGYWPYGYNSFHFDISKYIQSGENSIAVRLQNLPESSRWYPGAGLYRNVHLIITEKEHIPIWGTTITTPIINENFAKVLVKTKITNVDAHSISSYKLLTEVKDGNNHTVANQETVLTKYDEAIFTQNLIVNHPQLWNIDHPILYKAISKLYKNDVLLDIYETNFGIRKIEFLPNKGFYLNGKQTKFKGVCNHHDLGPLGAAVNEAAIKRQINALKEMGVNAIRTSHNMPAPELVKACDEMGMMLMAESFDEWKEPKMKNGYHIYFDEWAEKDLINLIHHYRNNPSIVMWCIGNEVPDQGTKDGPKIAKFLQDICHREDPTRPVTQGMDNPDAVLNNGMAAIMDIPGFNYRPYKYQEAYSKLPQQFLLGSETASTISSRGVYKFPVVRKSMPNYPDLQVSSYDVEHCSWSDLPEDNFIQHDDLPYSMGEFVWTGHDYLGEPTPYYEDWPSHSSLFGIIDLAGIPKDRYYLYRSHWNPSESTLHILPHWNWKGREGQITPVIVYTNRPAAELFINGKSHGVQRKDTNFTLFNTGSEKDLQEFNRQKRYRLMWMDVKYEPGTVKVVALDKDNKPAATQIIKTAGEPYKILLTPEANFIKADGKDIAFINVKLVDKEGNFCPTDERTIKIKVSGNGIFKAIANGNSASLESFQKPEMKLFSGQLTIFVQASETSGKIAIEATAKGLKPTKIYINTIK